VVQLAPGARGDDAQARELLAWCAARLADYQRPRALEFRAELPRTEAGKLERRALRAELWAGRERRI
jgi:acyl-coenzyme A synthetase/AMP-(fatty) acid ligase